MTVPPLPALLGGPPVRPQGPPAWPPADEAILHALQELGRATPADFDAAEQIGLRARHFEQALRFERRLGAEDVGVGLEADFGTAAIVDLAEVLELALGVAALKIHSIELLAAGDFDLELGRQRVHHGNADAMQAA